MNNKDDKNFLKRLSLWEITHFTTSRSIILAYIPVFSKQESFKNILSLEFPNNVKTSNKDERQTKWFQ